MKIINLTPHSISIADANGAIVRTIEPTSPAARVTSSGRKLPDLDGIPFSETIFGAVENLPPEDINGDVVYIVSQLVIAACPRFDLVRPDSGPTAIRGKDGQIVAVRGLTR